MKKTSALLIFNLFFILPTIKSQFFAGLTSGSVGLIGLEFGYSLNENTHVGGTIHPGGLPGVASFFGVLGRRTFTEKIISETFTTIGLRPYATAYLGVIKPPSDTENGISGYNTYTTTTSYPTEIGGSIGGGIEILIGESGKFGTLLEAGLGKMPNAFSGLSSNVSSTSSSRFTSAFYFEGGIRFYF